MKITPLDIVSMIAIASIVISAYAAARASKGQNAKQGKDTKPEKTEPSSPVASTSELRAELDDLKKRVAALEKKWVDNLNMSLYIKTFYPKV